MSANALSKKGVEPPTDVDLIEDQVAMIAMQVFLATQNGGLARWKDLPEDERIKWYQGASDGLRSVLTAACIFPAVRRFLNGEPIKAPTHD